MNSKTLRVMQANKPRTTSLSFVSMKFNKDDDQLEISYRDDKSSESAASEADNCEIPKSSSDLHKYISSKDNENKELETENVCDYISHNFSNQVVDENASKEFINKAQIIGSDDMKVHKDHFSLGNSENDNAISKDKTSVIKSSTNQDVQSEVLIFPSNTTTNEKNVEELILEGSSVYKDKFIKEQSLKKDQVIHASHSSDHSNDKLLEKSEKYTNSIDYKLSEEKKKYNFNYMLCFVQNINEFYKLVRNNTISHIIIIIIALFFAPIPSWLSGFLIGVFSSSCIFYWMFRPKKVSALTSKPILFKKKECLEFKESSVIFKGWMNLLPPPLEYNQDTYHVTSTRSVYVRLDGSYLRLSYPQNNIPKRAVFDEHQPEMKFIYQQHFDINGAVVELLPKDLIRKRLWSKKYPICIKIPNSKEAILSGSMTGSISSDSFSAKSASRKDTSGRKLPTRVNANNEAVIYLFSRTDREKDLWFKRFQRVAKAKDLSTSFPRDDILPTDVLADRKRTVSVDFASLQLCTDFRLENVAADDFESDSFVRLDLTKQEQFEVYMSSLLTLVRPDILGSSSSLRKTEKKEVSEKNLNWLNVLMGRIFFDVLSEEKWVLFLTQKIQKKLNKLKLPQFLSELTVKDINLGTGLPKIHEASNPSVDERGLWIDISLSYNGSFRMTLETKLDFMRLKPDDPDVSLSDMEGKQEVQHASKCEELIKPNEGSSSEDSAESSSEDEVPLIAKEQADSSNANASHKKRILRLVDRLAHSTYFQQAVRNKYVKRAVRDISNTPLLLTVEVQWLTGTLAINIPPAPTDRLWYGFRSNPSLSICARPKLGQHTVRSTHVTEWIEKKLISEFQKILVMPNMDDLVIPIMESDVYGCYS